MNRRNALLVSLVLTLSFNILAGIITLAYRNGITIVETNPYSRYLLTDFGAGALVVRAVEIASLYPLAYLLTRAISSQSRLFSAKRIYLFTFSFMIGLLPAAAFGDLLGDVMVVSLGSDLLSGFERILLFGLGLSIPFAAAQVLRGWTLVQGIQVQAQSEPSGLEGR